MPALACAAATSHTILGIDPGPTDGAHGWALLRMAGARPRYLRGGHDALSVVLAQVVALPAGSRVAVETPEGYVWHKARGKALLSTATAAGYFAGRARAQGLALVTPSAQVWRRAVCGKGTVGDADVALVVKRLVDGIPRTNAHVRDAIGVALLAALGGR